jgi:hypothetical protein
VWLFAFGVTLVSASRMYSGGRYLPQVVKQVGHWEGEAARTIATFRLKDRPTS